MLKLPCGSRRTITVLDGAAGTNLLDSGLRPGEPACVLNLRNPAAVYDLHRSYLEAGADRILTNTFNADPDRFSLSRLNRIIRAGVELARRAAGPARILADVSPLAGLLRPYGPREFDDARRAYGRLFRLFHRHGVRDFFLETFTSLREAKAAFLAGQPYGRCIFVSFTLDRSGRTLLGEMPETIALTFDRLGAAGIGVNCLDPDTAREAVNRMARFTERVISVKPNAGQGPAHAALDPGTWSRYFGEYIASGAGMIGGCCGTTPEHIRRLARYKRALRPRRRSTRSFVLAGPRRLFERTPGIPAIVGERLNPSGRSRLKNAIQHGDYSAYGQEAQKQYELGAAIVDINAFAAGVPETLTLNQAVDRNLLDAGGPVFIDTLDFQAAEKVLAAYPGVGVYNSISCQPRALRRFLPMVKRYGFKAVISLAGASLPRCAAERIANFHRARRIARQLNFPLRDLIFDPLVLPQATAPDQLSETLQAVEAISRQGQLTVLGISNVSYGMDQRSGLNASLAVLAIKAGVDFLIVNPFDENVMHMIRDAVRLFKPSLPAAAPAYGPGKEKHDLKHAVIRGDAAAAEKMAAVLLEQKIDSETIINRQIIPGLRRVGDQYRLGVYFLPDLLRSAAAAQAALALIRKNRPARFRSRRPVLMATVRGDIHDIGKNIAALVIESAGFRVIDLGKDVPSEKICEAVRRYRPGVVGLSALLTTTMPEMGRVITALRRQGFKVPVIIGGPNVSDNFARQIGAQAAARSAAEGLKIIQRLFHDD